jgi:hypothetical protein
MADGTIIENAYVVGMGDRIAVYGSGKTTFSVVYGLWGDITKTNHLESEQYGDKAEWNGYTDLYNIEVRDDGYTACLRRAADA